MIPYPTIDPVLLSWGPIQIRWYGVAYVMGIMMAMAYLKPILIQKLSLSQDQRSALVLYVMMGIMLGGRLGYIIFYDLSYYLYHPSQWIAVWNGGMSYHGGGIGAVAALGLFARKHQVSYRSLLDILGLGAPIGLFLGRIANFINAELYGRVTTVPWGMVFPNAGSIPRHPSQLYEAVGEGLFLFLILHYVRLKVPLKPGQLFGLHWVGYGGGRFIIEFFREPDRHLGLIWGPFTMGQLLCAVMITGGLAIMRYGAASQKGRACK